jgi:hypothetical protein
MLGIDEKRGTTTLCSGSTLYGKRFFRSPSAVGMGLQIILLGSQFSAHEI